MTIDNIEQRLGASPRVETRMCPGPVQTLCGASAAGIPSRVLGERRTFAAAPVARDLWIGEDTKLKDTKTQ